MKKNNKKVIKIGECAVDSGQIMLCDPCYIDSDYIGNTDMHDLNKSKIGEFSYEGCCNTSLQKIKEGSGQLCLQNGYRGAGVVCGDFGGDGLYPVFAIIKNNKVSSITIKFD